MTNISALLRAVEFVALGEAFLLDLYIHTCRDDVMRILWEEHTEGVKLRAKHRLKHRIYRNKVKHPSAYPN